MTKTIIGAGLAGLIAACKFKTAMIHEAAGCRMETHKALLRFRDRSVSDLIGIPFREVTVHKEIRFNGETHHRCSIAHANMYSRKVAGIYAGRSIWNLDMSKRYVAPENLYDQLMDMHQHRVIFNSPVMDFPKLNEMRGKDGQVISTAPMPAIMKVCGISAIGVQFERSTIEVDRYRLPRGTDVYQTIYFPDPDLRVFRASITGDLLIVESMAEQPRDSFEWLMAAYEEIEEVCDAFGITDATPIESVNQKFGKIVELPKDVRQAILYELTRDFGVFSIGRFATWRNILLDDVVKDISVIDSLMQASEYGRARVLAAR